MNFYRPGRRMPVYGQQAAFGYYGEPIEYYGEAPDYGYYGEPEFGYYGEPEYGFAEADYGEMEPVGYYAETPELVGWGMGEDPTGMGCTCGSARGMHGYGDYAAYVPDMPPRSIPRVIAATNLNGYAEPEYGYYGEPGYGEPEYGEPEYGEPEYGEPEYGEPGYGEPEYGEADSGYGESEYGAAGYGETEYGETDYGETEYGAYVAPSDVSPTCTNFTSPPASTSVPEHFRPYF